MLRPFCNMYTHYNMRIHICASLDLKSLKKFTELSRFSCVDSNSFKGHAAG